MSEGTDLEAVIEAAWVGFRSRLADHIAAMGDDDVLLVEFSGAVGDEADGTAPYVQLCAFGDDLVKVEAASNHSLAERCRLSVDGEAAMLALGWDELGDEEGRESFVVTRERRRADEVAVVLVATLRTVYAVPHPAFLDADDLEIDPAAPAVSTPIGSDASGRDELVLEGIPTSAANLQVMVDAAMETMFPDLKHDDDGDIPITAGSSLVFVRVIAHRPCVELYAEIVIGPQRLERLEEELVVLNAAHPLWKFARRDELVVMTHQMLALPFVAFALQTLVRRFVDQVDKIAGALAARVGGRRSLEEEPIEDERDLVLAGLLELLHLDRVHPATVAGLFAHDRLEIIRQIVRIRNGQQSCGDLDEDVVLTALRQALRVVSDGEPVVQALPPKPRRRSLGLPGDGQSLRTPR
ncbi:MAG: hypothetical protein WB471_13000 [Nocardioides sp.]